MMEINTLADTLRVQRLGAQEATALLRSVMAEIDVAIFAFDESHRLVLVEPLRRAPARARRAGAARPDGAGPGARRRAVGAVAAPGPDVRRRLGPLGDTPRALLAGRRAARPAGALGPQPAAARAGAPGVAAADSRHRSRAEQLAGADQVDRRAAWSRCSDERRRRRTGARHGARPRHHRLPGRRAQPLHHRLRAAGQAAAALAAAGRHRSAGASRRGHRDAAAGAGGARRRTPRWMPTPTSWSSCSSTWCATPWTRRSRPAARVTIGWTRGDSTRWRCSSRTRGPGLQSTGNLFVPLFTTKPGGSGIGLALSRQIAEGHDGSLTLANREDRPGARAILRLPMRPPG